MHNLKSRVLSLLLVMAMALSMVSGAFAVSPETDPENLPADMEVVEEEGADALTFDEENTIYVDADAEAEVTEEETFEEAVAEEAPVEEAPAVEEEQTAEEEENPTPAEDVEEPVVDIQSADAVNPKWTVTESSGVKTFTFTLNGNAANGYMLLPEMQDETGTYTFTEGVYFFKNGKLDAKTNGGSADMKSASVSAIVKHDEDETVVYTPESAKELVIVVGAPELKDNVLEINSALFSGWDSKQDNHHGYYAYGKPITGFFSFREGSQVFLIKDGESLGFFSGNMTEEPYADLPYFVNYQYAEKLDTFLMGGLTSGYTKDEQGRVITVVDGESAGVLYGTMQKTSYFADATTVGVSWSPARGNGVLHHDGKIFNGYYYNGKLYSYQGGVLKGVHTGTLGAKTAVWYKYNGVLNYRYTGFAGKRFEKGLLYNGVGTDRQYYVNGAKKAVADKTWLNVKKGNIYLVYYFKKDKDGKVKAVTGWNTITRSGVKYKYYFRKTTEKNPCAVVTDMFTYNSAYKKKKLEIRVSRSSDVGTILYYDSKAKAYVPCRSFVVSMSELDEGTKPGKYKLKKRSGWFTYVFEDGHENYYLYPTLITGSGSLFHSSPYEKKDRNTLICKTYNNLGKNTTHECVRTQVVVSKQIYSLVRTNKNITVYITKAKNVKQYLPFGKVTITFNFDFAGKLAGKYGFDPTDTDKAVKGKPVKLK